MPLQSRIAFLHNSTTRDLRAGDVIRTVDGTVHYIEYVNRSGAYMVPLAVEVRTVGGKEIGFAGGGKMISAASVVEIINPLTLGGNSQEYRRYALMAKKARDRGTKVEEHGVSFDEFDSTESEGSGEGTPDSGSETPTKESNVMAKGNGKANVKAKSAKREKVAKTVRKCVCGCNGETTGHFVPGHDARFHSWIKKLSDGRMEPKEVPAAVRNGLVLKQTSKGFQATKPHYYKD